MMINLYEIFASDDKILIQNVPTKYGG